MTETKAKALFEKGLEAGRKRDYHTGVQIFSQLVQEDYPGALLMLGRSYHGLGQFLEAVQVLGFFIRQSPESGEGFFFMGRSLLALGLFHRAASHLEKARSLGQDKPQVWGLLGNAYLKAKDPERAVQYLQKAVEAEPANKNFYIAYLNALFVQGIRLFHKGDYDMSRQILEFLLKSGAESTTIYLYLANNFKELGFLDQALHNFYEARKGAEEDPSLTFQIIDLLLKTGRKDQAMGELKKVQHLLPRGWDQNSATALEQTLPLQFLQSGKFRKAVFYALKALKSQPDNPQNYLVLGEAYRSLGQFEKSLNHFRQAQKRLGAHAGVSYGLIMVLWQMEDYESAYKEVSNLLKWDPNDDTAQYYGALLACKINRPVDDNLVILRDLIRDKNTDPFLFSALAGEYEKAGLAELAQNWAKRCLKILPDHYEAMQILLKTTDVNSKEDMGPYFQAYLKKKPQEKEILRQEIQYFLDRKDFQNAQKAILEYVSYGKKTPHLMKALAYCYRQEKQYSEAFLVYRDLLFFDPKDRETMSNIIFCLIRLGKEETAIRFAEKALIRGKPNISACYELGQVYFMAKDWDRASHFFRKVLEEDPSFWQAVEKISQIYEITGDTLQAQKFKKHAQNIRERKEKPLPPTQKHL